MTSQRPPTRSFDAVVRERLVTIAREAARQTGFRRSEPVGALLLPPSPDRAWRDRQARQQRYEAMVCERLAEFWIDAVPQIRERTRRH